MNLKAVGLICTLIFTVGVVFAFFWLWTQQTSPSASSTLGSGSSTFKQIEVSTVKKEAEEILNGKEKFSDIPISVKLNKMGRTNPFENVK